MIMVHCGTFKVAEAAAKLRETKFVKYHLPAFIFDIATKRHKNTKIKFLSIQFQSVKMNKNEILAISNPSLLAVFEKLILSVIHQP
jgi:hypothetical protein